MEAFSLSFVYYSHKQAATATDRDGVSEREWVRERGRGSQQLKLLSYTLSSTHYKRNKNAVAIWIKILLLLAETTLDVQEELMCPHDFVSFVISCLLACLLAVKPFIVCDVEKSFIVVLWTEADRPTVGDVYRSHNLPSRNVTPNWN